MTLSQIIANSASRGAPIGEGTRDQQTTQAEPNMTAWHNEWESHMRNLHVYCIHALQGK